MTTPAQSEERLRRWRLILGGDECDGTAFSLTPTDANIDKALAALYGPAPALARGQGADKSAKRTAGLGSSAPTVARWLGDIRSYFPSSVVRVMQKDALDRLDLKSMLLQPEMMEAVEPDVHLVADLISLNSVMPAKSRETARIVVRKVVEDLQRKLENPLRQAITGALNRSTKTRRPKHKEIDWDRTIRANLRHYQPKYKTIIPETKIGHGRKRNSLRDVILCIDQSGSMAASVVYAGVFAAVMASLPAVRTQIVVFDTAVVDLSDKLDDPVELLFGTQLGGGTDINRALAYAQSLVRNPADTILLLLSDLYEGGVREEMLKRATSIQNSGAQMIALLALSDEGAPAYDHGNTAALVALDVPAFACTPDLFPDMMAAAIARQPLSQWAAANDIPLAGRPET